MSEQPLNCMACGQAVHAGWKICPSCGKPLPVPAALSPVSDPAPMIQAGDGTVVKASIDASSHVHVEGQYVQKQTVVNVSSINSGLQAQIEDTGEQVRQIGQAVKKLLEQHRLQRRELRPGDSLSIRNDAERQLVKQVVARYRALPDADRQQDPALLNEVGKLEVVAGDFEAAQKDFQTAAVLEKDAKAQAEAHYNAYLVALEQRDWQGAICELVQAVRLDGKRFAPFPASKYKPVRILGAGGFGVAFLCKHRFMDAQVVVKTLALEDLGTNADNVFSEAQVLRQLDHPAVIRISDCGYVDVATRSRPFLVMDYFPPGTTLEDHVKKHGPLAVDDLLPVARQMAEGLHAAHGNGILHRDVKPANLLVRKDAEGWQAKVIDFGLALRQKVVQKSMTASIGTRSKTRIGDSIAGTLDYAAPEQMGKGQGDAVGPYSDIYGWAKTCCYGLFQTTQPTLRHWHSVPGPLANLLGRCLEEDPKKRPQQFAVVLQQLQQALDDMIPVVELAEVPVAQLVPTEDRSGPQPRKTGEALIEHLIDLAMEHCVYQAGTHRIAGELLKSPDGNYSMPCGGLLGGIFAGFSRAKVDAVDELSRLIRQERYDGRQLNPAIRRKLRILVAEAEANLEKGATTRSFLLEAVCISRWRKYLDRIIDEFGPRH